MNASSDFDAFGHQMGQELLQSAVAQISNCLLRNKRQFFVEIQKVDSLENTCDEIWRVNLAEEGRFLEEDFEM